MQRGGAELAALSLGHRLLVQGLDERRLVDDPAFAPFSRPTVGHVLGLEDLGCEREPPVGAALLERGAELFPPIPPRGAERHGTGRRATLRSSSPTSPP